MAIKKKEVSTKKTAGKSAVKQVKKATPKKASVKKSTPAKKSAPAKKTVVPKKAASGSKKTATVAKSSKTTIVKKKASASPESKKAHVTATAKPLKKAAAAKKPVLKEKAPAAKKTVVIKNDPVKRLADVAVEGILEVKGRNISVLDLRNIHNRVCDYFIICQADSNTQVNAIANSVEEMVKKITGERPYRKEGFENSEWILVDYVTVVVHIFQSHIRNFYNLESLWADAEVTELAFD